MPDGIACLLCLWLWLIHTPSCQPFGQFLPHASPPLPPPPPLPCYLVFSAHGMPCWADIVGSSSSSICNIVLKIDITFQRCSLEFISHTHSLSLSLAEAAVILNESPWRCWMSRRQAKMSDFVTCDILRDLWGEILKCHWTFLETEESINKLEERKKLEGKHTKCRL